METEAIRIGVMMQRRPLSSVWQPYQWHPLEIITDAALLQHAPCRLRNDASDVRWLFGGFDLKLYPDEAEGYFLNVHSPAPCWFVMWRPEHIDGEEVAVPKPVTLSYNEAARLLDGGEQVATGPLKTSSFAGAGASRKRTAGRRLRPLPAPAPPGSWRRARRQRSRLPHPRR